MTTRYCTLILKVTKTKDLSKVPYSLITDDKTVINEGVTDMNTFSIGKFTMMCRSVCGSIRVEMC